MGKDKIGVAKIVVTVKDVDINLTVAEAKELISALEGVVGKTEHRTEYREYVRPAPWPWPSYPRNNPYIYEPVWCSNDNTVRLSCTTEAST